MNYKMTPAQVQSAIREKLSHIYGVSAKNASDDEFYKASALVVRDLLVRGRDEFVHEAEKQETKQIYYLCMEFLLGRSLKNNLFNLGLEDSFRKALSEMGVKLDNLYEQEPDAGLGNGGLGRLAACFLDGLATQGYPAMGYSLRYEYGIFRQKLVEGWQTELPDFWLPGGEVWMQKVDESAIEVHFDGYIEEQWHDHYHSVRHKNYNPVMAIPYDLYVSGMDGKGISVLRIWRAEANEFDMKLFNSGNYMRAMEQKAMAETITKVLYPEDNHYEGKSLRLAQQYFLVSASVQDIVRRHLYTHSSLDDLPKLAAIHLNDTHPVLAIPELMRIMLDECGYEWDAAWDIVTRTIAYTNHTVMSEALERWNVDLFREQLPRVYSICQEINRRLIEHLCAVYPNDWGKINYMAVIANNEVRMANLCLAACHKVNGVSKLHTDILRNGIFRDYCQITPERFLNVTNGIAYRRWLCQSDPLLTDYLKQLIGGDFLRDARALEKLLPYQNDEKVLADLMAIKRKNKERLAALIENQNGVRVDPDSIFDIQIKRLHEYKRQLLNILHVLYLYRQIKANPHGDFMPRTFIFAAKASAGYIRAKQIISLIVAASKLINNDPDVNDKLKVVFLEDYKVSLAEIIIPAADISEQISIAGKEASGTGNMKLMINGAVTIGTLDGANVEIHEQVGDENIFLFGMKAHEVEELWQRGYHPTEFVTPELQAVLDMLTSGVLGQRFDDLVDSLLTNRFGTADPYMTLADFQDYARAQRDVAAVYQDKQRFARMSLINIAKAGIFSSDRAVKEYADEIWDLD